MKSRSDKLLKLVGHWVSQCGDKEVLKRLILRGVGLSTAEKIVHGRYKSTPKSMLSTILEEEMGKDGLSLDQGA